MCNRPPASRPPAADLHFLVERLPWSAAALVGGALVSGTDTPAQKLPAKLSPANL